MNQDPVHRTQNYLDRLAQKTYKVATPVIFGGKYHWTFGWTKKGKTVCLGPYSSEAEAERELSLLEDGEIFSLETRDVSRAVRVIKAELMARGTDPDEALKRVLHQKGFEREEERERRKRQ